MQNDETRLRAITRREALKKIGRFGIYVPATMAVLTAAPRAFAQSIQTPALEVSVTECSSGEPVEGAMVWISTEEPPPCPNTPFMSATTNSKGIGIIENIPFGNYYVSASKSGDSTCSRAYAYFGPGDIVGFHFCLTLD